MKFIKRMRAFTLVELLVVMAIIATLAGLAFPAIGAAITQSQMTTTLANAKQVYIAAQRMALDGASTGDSNLGWPADIGTNGNTVAVYTAALANGDYLPRSTFTKIFGAPGIIVPSDGIITGGKDTAFRWFKLGDADSSSCVFIATRNFTLKGELDSSQKPFNDKGFMTFRKGGDGGVYKRSQAGSANTNVYGQLIVTELE
jgi:prepilin-type N-terminal cleavage/methylation domain-containing protein